MRGQRSTFEMLVTLSRTRMCYFFKEESAQEIDYALGRRVPRACIVKQAVLKQM